MLGQGVDQALAGMQVVTAGVLVRALYRPLSRRSLYPGWQPAVAWRLPTLQGALNFVAYAGPICGVLITKVIIYGVPCNLRRSLQAPKHMLELCAMLGGASCACVVSTLVQGPHCMQCAMDALGLQCAAVVSSEDHPAAACKGCTYLAQTCAWAALQHCRQRRLQCSGQVQGG